MKMQIPDSARTSRLSMNRFPRVEEDCNSEYPAGLNRPQRRAREGLCAITGSIVVGSQGEVPSEMLKGCSAGHRQNHGP
jgi:hypothetical protein